MSRVTVTAAAYLVIRNARKTRKRKHRWWKKELFIGNVTAHNDFLGSLLANDQSLFTNFSRMSVEDFNILLEKVGPKIMKSDTNCREAIPPKIPLLVTLSFLATNNNTNNTNNLLTVYPIGLDHFCNFLESPRFSLGTSSFCCFQHH